VCFPAREFRIGERDVYLDDIAGCPSYIGAAQFEYWAHTQLTIDVVPGRGAGFTVEAPRGVRSSRGRACLRTTSTMSSSTPVRSRADRVPSNLVELNGIEPSAS
jgi:uncharacterized protein (DUF779 family)